MYEMKKHHFHGSKPPILLNLLLKILSFDIKQVSTFRILYYKSKLRIYSYNPKINFGRVYLMLRAETICICFDMSHKTNSYLLFRGA